MATVDPRPYTYEYRKPSKSDHLYESLYHRSAQKVNDYYSPKEIHQEARRAIAKNQNSNYVSEEKPLYFEQLSSERNRSVEFNKPRVELPELRQQKYSSNSKLPTINPQKYDHKYRPQQKITNNPRYEFNPQNSYERFRVFNRQQKPFNIINCYPRQQQSNRLRNFPKLTLEDKLIQRGSYRDFHKERF